MNGIRYPGSQSVNKGHYIIETFKKKTICESAKNKCYHIRRKF